VKHPRDRVFIDTLAAGMLKQQRAALPVTDLIYHPTLGPEILRDPTDSSYHRLLDNGILTEITSEWGMGGGGVKFTYPLIGAYALASHLRRQSTASGEIISTLVAQATGFALAWDAARILLLLHQDFSLLADTAGSTNAEMRELAVESLVALHADDSNKARQCLQQLLEGDSEEARRSVLKAAYNIGAGARNLFLWLAESKATAIRQAAQDILYLIWRRDPDFTYGLLHELLSRITLGNLLNLRRILEFVINLSITIYINNCDRQDVIDRTVKLHYELATERLHLQLLRTDILGPRFERLVFRAFASAFAKPILKAMVETNPASAKNFFDLPVEERACLKRIAPVLDPQTDLTSVKGDLFEMLQSEIRFFNICAALALGIHACHNFRATEPLLRELFDALDAHGRLWELLSFAVLMPKTPDEWVEFLEVFTARFFREHPDLIYNDSAESGGQLDLMDFIFVPLGLAYGKRGSAMPILQQLIRESVNRASGHGVTICMVALGPVGFHYPDAVFAALRASGVNFKDALIQDALVQPLAVIRTLHQDAVDIFIQQQGLDETFHRRVSATADVNLVHRYISLLGFYNNAFHFSLFYPKMRREFSMGAMHLLADADRPQDFIADYTAVAFRMFRDAGFRLSEWTLPK
jgi:hypothetical protein